MQLCFDREGSIKNKNDISKSHALLIIFHYSFPGSLRPGTTDSCVNINAPNDITYTVRITANAEACDQDPDQVISARIQFVGFGQVDVNIRLMCDCGCEIDAVSIMHIM